MGGPKMETKHGYSVFTEGSEPEVMQLKRVVLVVNPKSGGKRGIKIMEQVRPLLEAGGCEVRVVYTEYAGHAKVLAREEPLDEVDAFCPIGGDGTVHETVNGFMARADYEEVRDRVVIGIIPGGSGNTLAYDLHINTPAKAVELILGGSVRAIDCARVDSGAADSAPVYSINIIGFGLPSTVLRTVNSLRWTGGARYDLAAKLSLARNRGYQCAIEMVDEAGEQHVLEGKFAMVQAQVTVHMGDRMAFCPNAKLDDGLLDLVVIRHGGVSKMLNTMLAAQKTKHIARANVEEYKVRSFKLTPHKSSRLQGPSTVNVDGELVAGSPFEAKVMHKALRMVSS